MYFFVIALLVISGYALAHAGIRRRSRTLGGLGLAVWICTALLFSTLSLWGEMFWFRELGLQRRFWMVILARAGLAATGAVAGAMIVFLLTWAIPREKKIARIWPETAGAILAAMIGYHAWETILKFFNRASSGMTDPIFGRDIGFYFFTLPFYDLLYRTLFLLCAVSLAAALVAAFLQVARKDLEVNVPGAGKAYRPVYVSLSALLLVFSWGQYLNRFHLMNSQLGIVAGPGWTDVHVRIPALTILAVVSLICAAGLLIPQVRSAISGILKNRRQDSGNGNRELNHIPELATVIVPPAIVFVVWAIALVLAPGLVQWLRVEPNEITVEREYINHNINFTRYGFAMDDVEEREFPASEELTPEMIENNQDLMSEIRLWDWRALADVYEQFQEIRLYYTFPDIDIDRYSIDDQYRQVMVAAREMDIGSLSPDSQTFVNTRFKYTHGYGLTMSTVRDFTSEGLPNLLIKDIPPKWTKPSLHVDQPQIYYGTLTNTPVVANTKEKEFDYPSGEENVYTQYEGHGGVPLSSLWRKFIYGWMFDGTRFLLSSYPTKESRFLYRRQVQERVRRIAPFLKFENDAYIVLDQGKLYWIIDAYTTSDRLPYSEPFSSREIIDAADNRFQVPGVRDVAGQFHGDNYVRNSVKAVVDAFHGDVSFYIFEPEDPLIRAWNRIFPGMFKPENKMPPGLRAHVRYPETLLLTQGLVYTKYHMTDPSVFYNKEDLWVRATEKYYQQVQPVEPYYVMWKLPGTEDPEFVLILPFTPKNKQVMIGWMAGMCDRENYGRLLAYKFPKEKRILGPQQVETKIDQDSYLSGQLTLWDQRGSKVIRGNVLAIPIEDTLLYVEPIYLQAETAAYPELRLVAVMHEDNLSYAETFEEALQGLFAPGEGDRNISSSATEGQAPAAGTQELIRQAGQAFDRYLELQAEKKFTDAAKELDKLQNALDQLGATSED